MTSVSISVCQPMHGCSMIKCSYIEILQSGYPDAERNFRCPLIHGSQTEMTSWMDGDG